MTDLYSVSVQGIDSNISRANGSYDVIDYNDLPYDKVVYLLRQIQNVHDNLDYSKGDLCPPSFSIRFGKGEVFSFYVDNNKIYEAEFAEEFEPEIILKLAKGEIKLDRPELSKKAYESDGINPVRKRHIKPTDRNLKEEDINTDSNSPQFEEKVWRTRGWMEAANTAPFAIGGFFLIIGIIVMGEKRDADMAPIMFLIAVISFLLFFPWRIIGKTKAIYGIDWETNTLWIKRGKKILGFVPDANYVNDIQILKNEEIQDNPMWIIEPTTPMYFRKREWHIQYLTQGRDYYWTFNGSAHATKKEATRIVEKFKNLLEKS